MYTRADSFLFTAKWLSYFPSFIHQSCNDDGGHNDDFSSLSFILQYAREILCVQIQSENVKTQKKTNKPKSVKKTTSIIYISNRYGMDFFHTLSFFLFGSVSVIILSIKMIELVRPNLLRTRMWKLKREREQSVLAPTATA